MLKEKEGWWYPKNDRSLVNREDANRGYNDIRYHDYYIDVIEKHVRSHNLAIDVGANIGFMAIPFAKRFKEVHAFEPNQRVYEALVKNSNDFENLKCYNVALSDSHSEGKLFFRKGFNSSASAAIFEGTITDKNKNKIMEIDIVKLDEYNFTNVSLIKIDVEGFEENVVRGGLKLIQRERPLICLEMNDEKLEKYMEEIGYSLIQRHARIDGIFVPKEWEKE